MEVKVLSTEFPMKAKAGLNSKLLLSCATDSYIKYSTKKARPREFQEYGFMLKNMLPDVRGKLMPNYKEWW
jgi:hypothetical protein